MDRMAECRVCGAHFRVGEFLSCPVCRSPVEEYEGDFSDRGMGWIPPGTNMEDLPPPDKA